MDTDHPANRERISFIRNRTAGYSQLRGRLPRILFSRYPPNDSERAVKRIAAAYADMGFDVDIGMAFQSPVVLARIAGENDVHVIGILCISSESKRFVADLLKYLAAEFDRNIIVAVWISDRFEGLNSSSIKSRDGNLIIFGPETNAEDSAGRILDALESGPQDQSS